MTTENFFDWLRVNNCDILPADGFNQTGRAVKIVNNGSKVNNITRYHYFQGPFGDYELPDSEVRKICLRLWLTPPDCVKEK